MDINPNAVNLSAVGISLIFVLMVWKIPTWNNYPVSYKWIITILLPIICYFIGSIQADR